ncbi:MAG: cytochrome c oxidase accessory protein CcoG [Cyclobacteriaceae bacterium]|nr:cytochrome c oxidase accessory protein CcoG [Cyclobacteriaceae bacterium]MCH8514957.1 cytochrome c oxidase accessory protein CcoG [Cyclobacteriaceae bacterium]
MKEENQEAFRDSMATIREDGGRNWIFPKKQLGKFYSLRTYVSWVFLAMLFLGPFIKIGGQPLLMLNFFERKFIIFGKVFWPQDTYLLIFLLLIFFVFVIVFTVAFGRLFCGWACPQTLFMEMVFRKIEYMIDGDAGQQRKLAEMPWNAEKIKKRSLKFFIFLSLSTFIAHLVMAYLISWEQTVEVVKAGPAEHMTGFIALSAFTGIFFFVFWWFREQACTVVCPYGRLQGVLLDEKSIVVAYDDVRGEPRGKINKKEPEKNEELGDCIACGLCVQVCPTGIDIKNGTQMECINCTACIDACDEVMEKIGRPKELIRYASEEGIKEGKQKVWTTRVKAYSLVLLLLTSLFIGLIATRTDVAATITRFPGMTYQLRDDNQVSNLYEVSIINKTFDDKGIVLKIEDENFTLDMLGEDVWELEGQERIKKRFFLLKDREAIQARTEPVRILIMQDGEVLERVKTNFTGPI